MSDLVERFKAMRGMGAVIIEGQEISTVCDRIAQLERENAALLADARRMDWIQRQDFDDLYFIIFQDQPNDGKYGVSQGCIGKGWAIGDTFRAAIDAAIDAEMAKGEA